MRKTHEDQTNGKKFGLGGFALTILVAFLVSCNDQSVSRKESITPQEETAPPSEKAATPQEEAASSSEKRKLLQDKMMLSMATPLLDKVGRNHDDVCLKDNVIFSKDGSCLVFYLNFEREDEDSYVIPEGVTSIGDNAFSASSRLKSVTIPNSVTSIGRGAFSRCSKLQIVTLPEGLTSIGEGAFYECELRKITIPNSVTSIGKSAFSLCNALVAITVGNENSVYKSEDGVLFSKDGTKLISFPCGKNIESYVIPEGVTSIENEAFLGNSRIKSITIPESVTSIGDMTFFRCYALTDINIPESVTSFGERTFSQCSALTNVNISKNITSITDGAFGECYSLKAINVAHENSVYKSEDGVLFSKDGTKLIQFPCKKEINSYVIPEGVTSIATRAFRWNIRLESVTIPNSVTSIGIEAFDNCDSLKAITLPAHLTSIGRYISGCRRLKSITVTSEDGAYTCEDGILFSKDGSKLIFYNSARQGNSYAIPNGVTSIGEGAFWRCSWLNEIIIPESVTSIDDDAFRSCRALKTITLPNSITSIGENAFNSCDENLTIQGKSGSFAEEYAKTAKIKFEKIK